MRTTPGATAWLGMVTLAATVVAAWLAVVPRSDAAACSYLPISPDTLDRTIGRASIVAVGTLENATRDEVSFVVEESMKGTTPGASLALKNHPVHLGGDCSIWFNPADAGFYYPDGARVLMMLTQDDTDGRWYPEYFGNAWFLVSGDGLARYRGGRPWPSLSEVRDEIRKRRPEPTVPDAQVACDAATDPLGESLDETLRRSELVVVGEPWGSRVAATKVRVDEYLKGSGPADIDVLNRRVAPREVAGTGDADRGKSAECIAQLSDQVGYLPAGRKMLLFLTRDDSGLADWRPAMLGLGAFVLSDEQLNVPPGLPTLSELRAEAERVTGAPSLRGAAPPRPRATGTADLPLDRSPGEGADSGTANRWWWLAAAAGLGVLLGAGAVVGASRVRRRSGS